MTRLEKAQEQLLDCGVDTKIENDTLYVIVEDNELELSDFEINFRAKLYDDINS